MDWINLGRSCITEWNHWVNWLDKKAYEAEICSCAFTFKLLCIGEYETDIGTFMPRWEGILSGS